MKKSILFLTIATCVFMAMSCKKESCPAPETPSIVGYWKGQYGLSTSNPNQFMAILYRANGTVRAYADGSDSTTANKAEGTYTISGTSITTNFQFSGVAPTTSTGTVDSKFTLIRANWTQSAAFNGTWWLNKQ